jgi:hypothetical protein
MNRTWLVGTATITRKLFELLEENEYMDLDYDIQVDTNCGKFSWQFSATLTNDSDLFPEEGKYIYFSQNGPESFLLLKADTDMVVVQCEPASLESHLPPGVVKSIIEDLRDLARNLKPAALDDA